MTEVTIITTSDGSHSLLNTQLNETYHSVHGAIQESRHVFIRHGLVHSLQVSPKKEVRILEVGFGTGLNALLSLQYANQAGIKIYYESWEANPLDLSVVQQLNYGELLESVYAFKKIMEATWNEPAAISPDFTLHKVHGDILQDALHTTMPFDLIYYDAFAPSKQPDMWSREVLGKIISTLAAGGIFVTYCAKGQVKRDLASLGLVVETLTGPPGKKEMIRGSVLSQ
jgi:tRNA U34 5-methylaminomethyl-2-thiouridine-forming methyltransferase MnmC